MPGRLYTLLRNQRDGSCMKGSMVPKRGCSTLAKLSIVAQSPLWEWSLTPEIMESMPLHKSSFPRSHFLFPFPILFYSSASQCWGHEGSQRSVSHVSGEAQRSREAAEEAELKCTKPQVSHVACLLLGESKAQLGLCYEDKKTSWAIQALTQIGQVPLGNLREQNRLIMNNLDPQASSVASAQCPIMSAIHRHPGPSGLLSARYLLPLHYLHHHRPNQQFILPDNPILTVPLLPHCTNLNTHTGMSVAHPSNALMVPTSGPLSSVHSLRQNTTSVIITPLRVQSTSPQEEVKVPASYCYL